MKNLNALKWVLGSIAGVMLLACGGADNPTADSGRRMVALASSAVTLSTPTAPISGYTLVYQDDFSGTSVDESNWFYRENRDPTKTYAGGFSRKSNVSVSGGTLKVAFRKEDVDGNGTSNEYTGGGLISKHNFGYGYYETRAKLLGGINGFHQSFWSMGLPYGDPTSPGYDALVNAGVMPYYGRTIEIDGFEQDSNTSWQVKTNGHDYWPTHTQTGSNSHSVDSTNWFVMGYEWLPGQVKFYLNGTLVRTMPFNSLYGQSNFWLTGLANSVHSGALGSVPAGAQLEVDYFRFYGSSLVGVNRITNGGFEYNTTTMDLNYPMGWLEYKDVDSSSIYMGSAYAHSGSNTLWHHNETAAYTVTTKQNVENIPNGTYTLTAWIKSSGGQSQAMMRVLNHGGLEMTYNIPASASWLKVTIDNITVTSNEALIAFTSIAQSDQWIKVDDVVFVQK